MKLAELILFATAAHSTIIVTRPLPYGLAVAKPAEGERLLDAAFAKLDANLDRAAANPGGEDDMLDAQQQERRRPNAIFNDDARMNDLNVPDDQAAAPHIPDIASLAAVRQTLNMAPVELNVNEGVPDAAVDELVVDPTQEGSTLDYPTTPWMSVAPLGAAAAGMAVLGTVGYCCMGGSRRRRRDILPMTATEAFGSKRA